MKTDYEKLITHYISGDSSGEQNRLQYDQARNIEFITTMHFLLKHLPKGCSVLDCCAACGAYPFPLAKAGYKVTAGDLIQEHVDILNAENKDGLLECVYQGNVLDMSRFADETFDAVLCMGALYHLMVQEEREKCVSECLRVLKNGGIFVFAYVSRNAVYINHFNRNSDTIQNRDEILKTGVNGMFYTMDFNEQNELAEKFPLDKITDIGADGLIYPLKPRLNELTPEEFDAYMKYHIMTCEQPSIIGHSMHGLWIGRKI
jgi:2-polyprenyl-3-methyl-5-hydroxy-6-metoxy-1,4-benzoquinol methylase